MKSFGMLLVLLGILLLVMFPPMGVAGTLIIIGLISFVFGKDKRKANKAKETEKRKSQERSYSNCKEPILRGVTKCEHCQSEVPAEKEEVINEIIKVKNGNWECMNCHSQMLLAEDYCCTCSKHKKDIAIRLLNNEKKC
jgi:hypothetical protein